MMLSEAEMNTLLYGEGIYSITTLVRSVPYISNTKLPIPTQYPYTHVPSNTLQETPIIFLLNSNLKFSSK